MAANQKLTPLLAGRTIQAIEQRDTGWAVRFTDDSVLTLKTTATVVQEKWQNRTIKKVRQKATLLNLDFIDHATLAIPLAESTSSVLLRDRSNVLEYAD
jgi:hypothetical protein